MNTGLQAAPRLLIVEDERRARERLSSELGTVSDSVSEAVTAEGAVRLIDEKPFDYVVLDLALPHNDEGLEVVDHILDNKKKSDLIIYTKNEFTFYDYMKEYDEDDALLRRFFVKRLLRKNSADEQDVVKELNRLVKRRGATMQVDGELAELYGTLLAEVRQVDRRDVRAAVTDGKTIEDRVFDRHVLGKHHLLYEGAAFEYEVYQYSRGLATRIVPVDPVFRVVQ